MPVERRWGRRTMLKAVGGIVVGSVLATSASADRTRTTDDGDWHSMGGNATNSGYQAGSGAPTGGVGVAH